jgi:hypothetical protein
MFGLPQSTRQFPAESDSHICVERAGVLIVPWESSRSVYLRTLTDENRGVSGLPRISRLGQSEDADTGGCSIRLSRMSREFAATNNRKHRAHRKRAARVSRSQFGSLSQLYDLSSEDSRQSCRSELSAMKRFVWLGFCVATWAQQTQIAQDATKAPQDQNTPPAASVPAPAADRWLTGTMDLGYRWRTDPGGNNNVYRSIVDLGEGPKFLNADFSIIDAKRRWFDQIDTRAANWGDDPYTNLNMSVRKSLVYEFVSSYRNFAYFNNLPSFANPFLNSGQLESQRTFDMRNRMSSYELTFLPGTWLIPYLAYDRSSGYGNGVTTFVADQNEYAAPLRSNFSQNNMRGGLRLEMNRYHATIEQGGTTFRDDQSVFQATGANNPGNRQTSYLGNSLFLSGVSQAYGVRGDSVYTKAIGTAQPAEWLSLYLQYLYARPRSETNYQQSDAGNFILQSQALFFTSQQYLLNSAAKLPHQSGQAGAEIRFHPRVRTIMNWLTDRVHVSGENAGQNSFSSGSARGQIGVADNTELRNDYSHAEADVLWDVTSHLTLRGGYRYQWGRTSSLVLPPAGLTSQESSTFRRNTGKGGFVYRIGSTFSVNGDVEGAGTESAYFRTSLNQYQKGRIQGSYRATAQLTLLGSFSALSNQNPSPNIDLDYLGLQTSASVLWNPGTDKRIGFQGTYTRATIHSNIAFLIPQTLKLDQSRYRDNSHTIQGMFDLVIPGLRQARLSMGGNVFISSGSRPTSYFQPAGKFAIPLSRGVAWISEWTYYGYGESFYSYEGFRTHLITTGVRLTL